MQTAIHCRKSRIRLRQRSSLRNRDWDQSSRTSPSRKAKREHNSAGPPVNSGSGASLVARTEPRRCRSAPQQTSTYIPTVSFLHLLLTEHHSEGMISSPNNISLVIRLTAIAEFNIGVGLLGRLAGETGNVFSISGIICLRDVAPPHTRAEFDAGSMPGSGSRGTGS